MELSFNNYTLRELKPLNSESFEWFIRATPRSMIMLKAEHPKCNTVVLQVWVPNN